MPSMSMALNTGQALDGTRARGIDVYHGHPVVSWSALESAPEEISFLGVKTSDGMSFTDPKLLWHREGFRSSTMEMAVYYHFAEPGDARAQARRYRDLLGDLDPRERLALDWERSPALAAGNMNKDFVDAFYDELMSGLCTDRRHFIYSSKNQWDRLCGGVAWDLAADIDLWAPRYSTGADLEPIMPAPWADRGWNIWQFSDGKIPPHQVGGVGVCDGNVWNGNRESLRAYVASSGAPPAPPPPLVA